MLKVSCFHFNFIQVNTYFLFDETKEAVIVDPGNCEEKEDQELADFVQKNQLKIKYIINTHPHIDHIIGNGFCHRHFQAPIILHPEGLEIYRHAFAYGVAFNMKCDEENFPPVDLFIKEGDTIRFGNQTIEILYTPGHADGSISLVLPEASCVFVGDVLFENSIGRSDLPTGNFRTLIENIHKKILVLPDHYTIYPGHGPETTIGKEKNNNPYIQQKIYH